MLFIFVFVLAVGNVEIGHIGFKVRRIAGRNRFIVLAGFHRPAFQSSVSVAELRRAAAPMPQCSVARAFALLRSSEYTPTGLPQLCLTSTSPRRLLYELSSFCGA